jgi:hypothetical protein
METLVVNFQNVSTNNLNLQNFMIESTNRESQEMEVQNERV